MASISNSEDEWDQTHSYFESAIPYQNYLLRHANQKRSSIILWSKLNILYDGLVNACYELGNFDPCFIQEAIHYSEQFQSPILKEKVYNRTSRNYQNLQNQLTTIQHTIDSLEGVKIISSSDKVSQRSETPNPINHLLFESHQKKTRLIQLMEKNTGIEIPEIKIKLLQRELKSDQSILKYHISHHHIFSFLIKRDGLITKKWPKPENFEKNIISLYKKLSTLPIETSFKFKFEISELIESSTALYKALLQPIRENLTSTVTIIPNGITAYIPFEALLSSKPKNKYLFADYPFLLNECKISYALSLQLYHSSKEQYLTRNNEVLAIAPYFPKGANLGPLYANHRESKRIVDLMGGKLITETSNIKDQLSFLAQQYSILHFSTHGILNKEYPDASYLAMTDSSSSQNLFFSDLYYTYLPSNLVVLSACETGIGKGYHGEGLLSLENAFTAAGAKSVISSKWIINDEQSAKLLELFFEYLAVGIPKNEALRQAKLDFINYQNKRNPQFTHPYYWAALTISGNIESLPQQKSWFEGWNLF